MIIAGYAQLRGELVGDKVLEELRRLGDADTYGCLFIYERDALGVQKRWTLFGADAEYARMIATEVGTVEVPAQILRSKFPAFVPGWVIEEDPQQ
jgi:hypothetical protein